MSNRATDKPTIAARMARAKAKRERVGARNLRNRCAQDGHVYPPPGRIADCARCGSVLRFGVVCMEPTRNEYSAVSA